MRTGDLDAVVVQDLFAGAARAEMFAYRSLRMVTSLLRWARDPIPASIQFQSTRYNWEVIMYRTLRAALSLCLLSLPLRVAVDEANVSFSYSLGIFSGDVTDHGELGRADFDWFLLIPPQ
jgi:hypothetical protein